MITVIETTRMQSNSIKLLLVCLLLLSLRVQANILYVDLNSTNPTAPYPNWGTASVDIQSAIDVAVDGDQILVTNGVYVAGGRTLNGALTNRVVIDKAVVVQSVNGPGVTAIQGNKVLQQSLSAGIFTNGFLSVRCVYVTNGAVLSGFTLTNGGTWLRASANPYDLSGAGAYCETNATVTNCTIVGCNSFGSGGGVYQGYSKRCIITNNVARLKGGGAFGCILMNSTLVGNSQIHPNVGGGGGAANCNLYTCYVVSNFSAAQDYNNTAISGGGGALHCIFESCIISSNYSSFNGGGVSDSTLNNCLLLGNTSSQYSVGAASSSALTNCTVIYNAGASGLLGTANKYANCILYFNRFRYSADSLNYYFYESLNFCDTDPLPDFGKGNISTNPNFQNTSNDFRLQSGSACINAGNNAYVSVINDLVGNPRIVRGTVDIGAYEFQSPSSVLSYAWAQQNDLPTDGSADFLDSDGDGFQNWQEWIAGTNPTNAASVLKMNSTSNSAAGSVVMWQSVGGVTYYLQRSTNLPAFTTLQSNLVGEAVSTSYTDVTATNGTAYFYRVGVQ